MYIISYLLDNKKKQTRIYTCTYIKNPGSVWRVTGWVRVEMYIVRIYIFV